MISCDLCRSRRENRGVLVDEIRRKNEKLKALGVIQRRKILMEEFNVSLTKLKNILSGKVNTLKERGK